jgi:hypothetical protein
MLSGHLQKNLIRQKPWETAKSPAQRELGETVGA